jgi:hypothetical protein
MDAQVTVARVTVALATIVRQLTGMDTIAVTMATTTRVPDIADITMATGIRWQRSERVQ